jgi:hypothetical protein
MTYEQYLYFASVEEGELASVLLPEEGSCLVLVAPELGICSEVQVWVWVVSGQHS